MRLWGIIGRVVYWLGWPVLFVYLYPSRRKSVVVTCGDEVLVLKGWLGNGHWSLPGGGLHRGEDPATGAVRELREEVGIVLEPQKLTFMYKKSVRNESGFRFGVIAYRIELQEKPPLAIRHLEVQEAKWLPKDELLNDAAHVSRNTHEILCLS